ncbi:VOC family protein [Kineococcus rhizosphaerae]|uniref:VOC family protein n=1 Tax=Kineococcus rhizosphaerae TaxID=559628 RepID=UPI000D0645E0|nr:VOC family protein [Kineococcus rhizosphaerae]
MTTPFPRFLHTVLDATDARALAEFYRELLGLRYRPGDEGTAPAGWLVLTEDDGTRVLAFEQVDELPPSTWPSPQVPAQVHVDFTVPDRQALAHHHERALQLGARHLRDGSEEAEEPIHVYADPAGHPFCIFVA